MIWPIPFGTVVVRPHIKEEELKSIQHLFQPGEVVDCGGYRNRDAWILMPDRTWEKLHMGDDEYITIIPRAASLETRSTTTGIWCPPTLMWIVPILKETTSL